MGCGVSKNQQLSPRSVASYPADRRYSLIADPYRSPAEVGEALKEAGLESTNLIIGIDFTKSNEWNGKNSFRGYNLHHISDYQNQYEQAISIVGETLTRCDGDNLIPCFGFGDASTQDRDVFSFYPDNRPCDGFNEALVRYRELIPHVNLSGPTSFAPIIEMAMTIVEKSGGQYHVLLIIADGEVTRSVDTDAGQLSPEEQLTVDAFVRASVFPLSIVVVGVGDGLGNTMKQLDDNRHARFFDNFHFVNFTKIMSKNLPEGRKEAEFALKALKKIPIQYATIVEHELLRQQTGRSPNKVALSPPGGARSPYDTGHQYTTFDNMSPSAPNIDSQNLCPICLDSPKDIAFGCGHRICVDCSQILQTCPICRHPIEIRIKLY